MIRKVNKSLNNKIPNSNKKVIYWDVFDDDKLEKIDEVIEFINSEFDYLGLKVRCDKDYIKWKLSSKNIYGKGCLSYASDGKSILGVVIVTKKKAWINGAPVYIGEIGDCYTNSIARRRGVPLSISKDYPDKDNYINKSIFGRLAYETQKRAENMDIKLIYGTPNKNAYPGWIKRLNYSELSHPKIYCYTKPTLDYFAEKIKILKYLNYIDYLFLRLYCFFNSIKNSKILYKEHALPTKENIDNLWESSKYASEFTLERDYKYWDYRYLKKPKSEYLFCEINIDSLFAGIIVCKYQRDNKKFIFVEWMLKKEVSIESVFSEIIMHALSKYRPHTFSLWINENIFEKSNLRYMFFSKRSYIPIIFAPTKLGDIVKNIDKFTFHFGTSDNI